MLRSPTSRLVNRWPPTTCIGTRENGAELPAPSCPYELSPQHHASPVAVTPQALASPTSSRTKRVGPLTSTGVELPTDDPSPRMPAPQQYARPSDRSAQLN